MQNGGRPHRMLVLLLTFGVGVSLLLAPGVATSQSATWTAQKPATRPHKRYDAAMAQTVGNQVVLFSGATLSVPEGFTYLSDTWTWDGVTWRQPPSAQTGAPAPRQGASMAFDPVRNRTVLFGGFSFQTFDDTWEFDGFTWRQVNLQCKGCPLPVRPPARYGAAMTYDFVTGTILLYGGTGTASQTLNDFWEWNGATWKNLTTGSFVENPGVRSRAGFASLGPDASSFLVGGGNAGGVLNDTWAFISRRYRDSGQIIWVEQSSLPVSPGRTQFGLARYPVTGKLVLFGGTSGSPLAPPYSNTTYTFPP